MELRGCKDHTETGCAWGASYHSGHLECFALQKKAVVINSTLLLDQWGPNVLKCK